MYISGKQKAKGALSERNASMLLYLFRSDGLWWIEKKHQQLSHPKARTGFCFYGVVNIQCIYHEIKRADVAWQLINGAAFEQNCSCKILTYDYLFLLLDSSLLMAHFLHVPDHRAQFAACYPCVCVLLSPLCPRAGHMAHKPLEESTANPSLSLHVSLALLSLTPL